MVAAEIMSGLGGLKAAFDIAKALKDIDDATRRNAAIIDLQEKILSAQQAQGELIKRVDDLERELADFNAWEAERKRYQLKDFGGGTFAYELKQSEAAEEPIHRACPACYKKQQISILQPDGRNAFKQEMVHCPACKAEFRLGVKQEPEAFARGSYNPRF